MLPRSSKQVNRSSHSANETTHILVIDSDDAIGKCLGKLTDGAAMQIHYAASIQEAWPMIHEHTIDMVFVDRGVVEGQDLAVIGELKGSDTRVGSLVVMGESNFENARDAIRAGATDYLGKPLDLTELASCIDRASRFRSDCEHAADRVARLRRLCKRLNKARQTSAEEVDSLRSDLMNAYETMVGKVKYAELVARFRAAIEQDLDLEQVLRRYLEIVLQQVGPTNAAVFLPSLAGEYTVGGYINYNLDKSSLNAMMDDLSRALAEQLTSNNAPVCLSGTQAVTQWLGESNVWLSDSSVMMLTCRYEEDVLAGLLLFREANEPFEPAAVDALNAIAPILAEHLTKVIHIHHRLNHDDEALDHGEGFDTDEMEFE